MFNFQMRYFYFKCFSCTNSFAVYFMYLLWIKYRILLNVVLYDDITQGCTNIIIMNFSYMIQKYYFSLLFCH
jgi:hypothetical protein